MKEINSLPNSNYGFGEGFNYAVWTEGTQITLVNVPWNNDYRDIVRFQGKSDLNTYIDSQQDILKIDRISYLKPLEPIRINVPFNSAYRFNYLRASNPLQPIAGDTLKDFYYFITAVNYLSPNTTELTLQLDVWQTFGYDIKFGNCYIERGHIGIANQHNFDNFGRDYLTVPEGLDIGAEYRTIARRNEMIMGNRLTPGPGDTLLIDEYFDILVISTVDITADPGTVDNPHLTSSSGGSFEGLPTGADMVVFQGYVNFIGWLATIADKPWVTQGIISVTAIPKISRYVPTFPYNANTQLPTGLGSYVPTPLKHNAFPDWRNQAEILNNIPDRYKMLKKFLTSPYMVIELTTWSGTPLALKPEMWADNDAYVMERVTYTPPGQRVELTPRRYNSNGQAIDSFNNYPEEIILAGNRDGWRDTGDDSGDYLDLTAYVAGFPNTVIANNGQLLYLAQNHNTIAYQHTSAEWSQQRALQANSVSYDQATSGMDLAKQLTNVGIGQNTNLMNLQNQTMQAKFVPQAIGEALGGTVGGAIGGSGGGAGGAAAGAMAGAVSSAIAIAAQSAAMGIQVNSNEQANAINNQAARATVDAGNTNRGYVRDTNKTLADWAANGDYGTALQAINAKVQDARMIQPTTSGQLGGQASNFVNGTMEFSIRWKLIDNANMRRIGEFWLRYGYAINQFSKMPDNFMVMSHFTYWKLRETYIIAGAMPETYKQAIRGIFEKGVTVYARPEYIGNIDMGINKPLAGITL